MKKPKKKVYDNDSIAFRAGRSTFYARKPESVGLDKRWPSVSDILEECDQEETNPGSTSSSATNGKAVTSHLTTNDGRRPRNGRRIGDHQHPPLHVQQRSPLNQHHRQQHRIDQPKNDHQHPTRTMPNMPDDVQMSRNGRRVDHQEPPLHVQQSSPPNQHHRQQHRIDPPIDYYQHPTRTMPNMPGSTVTSHKRTDDGQMSRNGGRIDDHQQPPLHVQQISPSSQHHRQQHRIEPPIDYHQYYIEPMPNMQGSTPPSSVANNRKDNMPNNDGQMSRNGRRIDDHQERPLHVQQNQHHRQQHRIDQPMNYPQHHTRTMPNMPGQARYEDPKDTYFAGRQEDHRHSVAVTEYTNAHALHDESFIYYPNAYIGEGPSNVLNPGSAFSKDPVINKTGSLSRSLESISPPNWYQEHDGETAHKQHISNTKKLKHKVLPEKQSHQSVSSDALSSRPRNSPAKSLRHTRERSPVNLSSKVKSESQTIPSRDVRSSQFQDYPFPKSPESQPKSQHRNQVQYETGSYPEQSEPLDLRVPSRKEASAEYPSVNKIPKPNTTEQETYPKRRIDQRDHHPFHHPYSSSEDNYHFISDGQPSSSSSHRIGPVRPDIVPSMMPKYTQNQPSDHSSDAYRFERYPGATNSIYDDQPALRGPSYNHIPSSHGQEADIPQSRTPAHGRYRSTESDVRISNKSYGDLNHQKNMTENSKINREYNHGRLNPDSRRPYSHVHGKEQAALEKNFGHHGGEKHLHNKPSHGVISAPYVRQEYTHTGLQQPSHQKSTREKQLGNPGRLSEHVFMNDGIEYHNRIQDVRPRHYTEPTTSHDHYMHPHRMESDGKYHDNIRSSRSSSSNQFHNRQEFRSVSENPQRSKTSEHQESRRHRTSEHQHYARHQTSQYDGATQKPMQIDGRQIDKLSAQLYDRGPGSHFSISANSTSGTTTSHQRATEQLRPTAFDENF